MKLILISLAIFFSSLARADIQNDFDSLGGNTPLLERAKALNPETVTSIVQNRTVNLNHRFELAPEISGTFGGDTYSRTHSFGLNAQYHINPRWSIGAKYNYSFNTLTAEGEAMIDRAIQDAQNNPKTAGLVPQMDYPKYETLALINWYPIYGKMNLYDKAVAHFDIYGVLGGGEIALRSGSTATYTGGLGVGLWLNPNTTARLEVRYQRYKAQYVNGAKDLDLAVGGLQMGWLL